MWNKRVRRAVSGSVGTIPCYGEWHFVYFPAQPTTHLQIHFLYKRARGVEAVCDMSTAYVFFISQKQKNLWFWWLRIEDASSVSSPFICFSALWRSDLERFRVTRIAMSSPFGAGAMLVDRKDLNGNNITHPNLNISQIQLIPRLAVPVLDSPLQTLQQCPSCFTWRQLFPSRVDAMNIIEIVSNIAQQGDVDSEWAIIWVVGLLKSVLRSASQKSNKAYQPRLEYLTPTSLANDMSVFALAEIMVVGQAIRRYTLQPGRLEWVEENISLWWIEPDDTILMGASALSYDYILDIWTLTPRHIEQAQSFSSAVSNGSILFTANLTAWQWQAPT
jgi:hypothetical protein